MRLVPLKDKLYTALYFCWLLNEFPYCCLFDSLVVELHNVVTMLYIFGYMNANICILLWLRADFDLILCSNMLTCDMTCFFISYL